MGYPLGFELLTVLLLVVTFCGTYNILGQLASYGALYRFVLSLFFTVLIGTFFRYIMLLLGILTLISITLLVYRVLKDTTLRRKMVAWAHTQVSRMGR